MFKWTFVSGGVERTWIVNREDVSVVNNDDNPTNDGPPDWRITNATLLVKENGQMKSRVTYNLGTKDQPLNTGYTIEWKGTDGSFARYMDSYTKSEDPAIGRNHSRVLMAKAGAGADRVIGKQTWYDGERLLSVNDDGSKTYDKIQSFTTMTRYADTQVVKQSVMVSQVDGQAYYTVGSMAKDLQTGQMSGAVWGQINISDDPDAPDYETNVVRVIVGDDTGTMKYTFQNTENGWVQLNPDGNPAPDFIITVNGNTLTVSDNDPEIYITLTRPVGGNDATAQQSSQNNVSPAPEKGNALPIVEHSPSMESGVETSLKRMGLADPAAFGLTPKGLLQIIGTDGVVETIQPAPESGKAYFSGETADASPVQGLITINPRGSDRRQVMTVESLVGSYSGPYSVSTMRVTYQYDEKGRLIAAEGEGSSVSDDGFGNITTSRIEQKFVIINGQAKLKESLTASHTVGMDGTESWMDGTHGSEKMRVEYFYSDDPTGALLIGPGMAARGDGISTSLDSFGTSTVSRLTQEFTAIRGEARLTQSVSASISVAIDGSRTYSGWADERGNEWGSATVVSYSYDERTGRLMEGAGKAAHGRGESVSDDAFGNRSTSVTEQFFTSIRNQAKLEWAVTSATSLSIDGTSSVTHPYAVHYDYNAKGELTGATLAGVPGTPGDNETPAIVTHATDSFGNFTETKSLQTFLVVNGQAKVETVTTRTRIRNADGSRTVESAEVDGARYAGQDSTVRYAYHDNGLLRDAENTQASIILMDDGFGNITVSETRQEFDSALIKAFGRVLLSSSINSSRAMGVDGTVTITDAYAVAYQYDERGLLADAHLVETSAVQVRETPVSGRVEPRLEKDPLAASALSGGSRLLSRDGNRVRFEILDSVKKTESEITTADPIFIQLGYSQKGDLESVRLEAVYQSPDGRKYPIHSTTVDAFGNVTESWTAQEFVIIAGQAKLASTITHTEVRNMDGSHTLPGASVGGKTVTAQDSVVSYTYHENGLLKGAENTRPSVILMDDGYGNITVSETRQEFDSKWIELTGKALVTNTVSHNETANLDGSSQVQDMTVTYDYDNVGRLASAAGAGKFDGDDGFGNLTSGDITQVY
ncbi:MAG: hypothetical protein HY548_05060, partial [Elusimicrobia bacterium]|nr:hypothetical protein [Elusimicrobiota bacterium]